MSKKRPLLNKRDIAVLCWIGEQRAVRLDQLQRLLARERYRLGEHWQKETKEADKVSLSTAERRVRQWQERGLVKRDKSIVNDPAWVWLTKQGIGFLDNPYRYHEPKYATMEHTFWVNQVRLSLESQLGLDLVWKSERAIRFEYGQQEATKKKHVPDAVISLETGRIAIEVELTPKEGQRTKTIIRRLAYEYDQVWYYTNNPTYNHIFKHVDELGDALKQKFSVFRLSELGN